MKNRLSEAPASARAVRRSQTALENIVFISKVQDALWLDVGDIHFSNGKCSTLVLFKRLKPYPGHK